MPDWFSAAVQFTQSVMLGVCAYFLLDGVRTVKRVMRIVDDQQKLLREMDDIIRFQHGVIAALQAGVFSTRSLPPRDFSNLPVELRVQIMVKLVDIGVQAHMRMEDRDAHQGHTG